MITPTSIWSAIVAAKSSIFTGAICVALCLPLGYCKGYDAAKSKAKAEIATANVTALRTAKTADDVAAVDRVADALELAQDQQELTDAITNVPDTLPDDTRVALGCERLRAAGSAEAALPAVCRPAGGN